MTTVRSMLVVAANNKWIVHQLDVNNAFVYGDLHENVYMIMSQGIINPKNKLCLLKKILYALKQAYKQWHEKLVIELKVLGFGAI